MCTDLRCTAQCIFMYVNHHLNQDKNTFFRSPETRAVFSWRLQSREDKN